MQIKREVDIILIIVFIVLFFSFGAYMGIKDQNGDMIVLRGPRKGVEDKFDFKHGTGKYEGIKGTFKSELAIPLEGMMDDLKKYMEKN